MHYRKCAYACASNLTVTCVTESKDFRLAHPSSNFSLRRKTGLGKHLTTVNPDKTFGFAEFHAVRVTRAISAQVDSSERKQI